MGDVMPADDVAKLRNVAIVGQGGTGKTTVADALLFAAGAVNRLGRLDDDSSPCDHAPEGVARRSTISAALAPASWSMLGLNVIATPGYSPFRHDTRKCRRAVSGAGLVRGSTGGEVKVESEKVGAWLDELELP